MKSKSIASIIAIALAVASVTACSDKSSKSGKPETAGQMYAKEKKSLPHADINVPDSSYQLASIGNADLYFATLALQDRPVDYDAVAKTIDYKYSNTTDAFKKQELLQTLRQRIDQGISNAKSNRYYIITDNNIRFGHYDFEKKSFPIESFINPEPNDKDYAFVPEVEIYNPKVKHPNMGQDAYKRVIVTNPESFTSLSVTDQNTARRMEEFINTSSYDKPYNVEIYTVIQGYQKHLDRSFNLYGEITKIRVVDYKGNLIGETSLKK